jgi:hypothetical protein
LNPDIPSETNAPLGEAVCSFFGIGRTQVNTVGKLAAAVNANNETEALHKLAIEIRELSLNNGNSHIRSAIDLSDSGAANSPKQMYPGIEDLPDRERHVLIHRFGLFRNETRTLESIGDDLGVTRERVRQIEKKALSKLPENTSIEIRNESFSSNWEDRMLSVARQLVSSLSSRAGEDIHFTDDVVRDLIEDPDSWYFELKGAVNLSQFDPWAVVTQAIDSSKIIWLDNEKTVFLKYTQKHPCHNVASRLLSIFDEATLEGIHDGVAQIWSKRTFRAPFNLTVDDMVVLLKHFGYEIVGNIVKSGTVNVPFMEMNHAEIPLVEYLMASGGFSTLDDMRIQLPELLEHGTTQSQYLFGTSPLFERLGPSLYGLRGYRYAPGELSSAQKKANSSNHLWVNRASWESDINSEVMSYRLSDRRDPPASIGVSETTAYWLSNDWNGESEELSFELGDSTSHLLRLARNGASIRLHGLNALWDDLDVHRGDTLVMIKQDRAIRASLKAEQFEQKTHLEINLGSGWIAHAR